jgi:hypothetical protein
VIRNQQDAVFRQLAYELFGVSSCNIGLNLKFATHAPLDDVRQRRPSISRLPDHGRDLIQGKECRVQRGHDHHLAPSMRAAMAVLRAM